MNNVSVSFVIKLCFTFYDCLRSQDGNSSGRGPKNCFINHTHSRALPESMNFGGKSSVKEAAWKGQFTGRKRSWHKHLISKVFNWAESSHFCENFTFHRWPLWSVKHNTSLLCCCRCKLGLNLSRRHCRNIFRSSIKLMFVFMKIVYKFACPFVILRLETFLCVGFYGCCCLLSDISFSKITWGL